MKPSIFILLANVLSFSLIFTVLSTAQEFDLKFDKLTIDNGLSQSAIHCILQDRKGFMWFGTKDGLNRYDGYNFKVYLPIPEDTNSISSGYILSLCEDREGHIWVGTNGGGLNRFDPLTEKFTRYQPNPQDDNSLSHNVINKIIQDRNGSIWIATNGGGLNEFDISTGKFARYRNDLTNPLSLSCDLIKTVYEDKQGNLWIGIINSGLDLFDRQRGEFQHFFPEQLRQDKSGLFFTTSIIEDRAGTLWVGTYGKGLFTFDSDSKAFTYVPTISTKFGKDAVEIITDLLVDNNNALWICSNGLGLFKLQNNVLSHYIYDPTNPAGLSANSVKALCLDRSGTLWAGTNGLGINYTSASAKRFTTYKPIPQRVKSMTFSSVRAIYEAPNGDIWVGGYGGINRLDRKTGEFENVAFNNSAIITTNSNKAHISNAAAYCFLPDVTAPNKKLWIGTEGGGLYKIDMANYKLEELAIFDKGQYIFPVGMEVYTLNYDEEGFLWMGTDKALNKFNPRDHSNVAYEYDKKISEEFFNCKIKALILDSEGMFWLGFEIKGLVSFDRKSEKFTVYCHRPGEPSSLSNDRIYALLEDSKKRIWVGTAGGGLNLFDRKTGSFTAYTENDGLPNNVINAILEDHQGNLWLSTNKGLSKFNPEAKTFENYDVNDGLQSNEFNAGARFKSDSGELFFGGISGFTRFYPDSIRKNPTVPPLVLTDLKVFNISVPVGKKVKGNVILNKSITFTDELSLSYREKFFTLEFSALNYLQPAKNQYAYMLEGFEEEWNYVGRHRFATYTNLAPGEYIFRVKGSNNDGIWNETGASLKITIPPPYWETWWFRAMTVLSVISLVIAFYLWRINRMRQTALQLEAMVKERTSELEEAMNNIKVLKGLIPICASCKKVRDDSGYWRQVEDYISHHTEVQFSHGICPDCMKKLYPQFYKEDD